MDHQSTGDANHPLIFIAVKNPDRIRAKQLTKTSRRLNALIVYKIV
jgi:hypothetical protein